MKKYSLILFLLIISMTACGIPQAETKFAEQSVNKYTSESEIIAETVNLDSIPSFSGTPYVVLNGNIPEFQETEYTTESFEFYSELDELGRCGVAYGCIGKDIMPTEERESIGQVKPSGWHLVKYDCIEDNYLYNRCHLIGFQLAGENANEKNLITGTRYMNVKGMLPFENQVADYVKDTGNHVLYRVTPVYKGSNLVANGVQMEAWSVEDGGKGICFNVYVYNQQPGIVIDYATGESWIAGENSGDIEIFEAPKNIWDITYVLNTNTKKFHYITCESVEKIMEKNKQLVGVEREDLISQGYEPCGNCKP